MSVFDCKVPDSKRAKAIAVSAKSCADDIQGMKPDAQERLIAEYLSNIVARARQGEFE